MKLRVFDLLAHGPLDAGVLSARLDLSPQAGQRLFAAAVSLRLLQWRGDGQIGLGRLGAPMVGNAALTAMVEHHDVLYADLANPLALLRADRAGGDGLAAYWPYAAASLSPDRVAAYTALMAASQSLVADQILDAYPVGRHRRLLDIGGGDGSFLVAATRRCPALRGTLFDLPAVAHHARQRLADERLLDRVEVHGGSFLLDPLPPGADLATLIRVIHDHDDPAAMTILRAARAALPPHGRLLLAEPLAQTPGAEPMGDAYFGFYLLAMGSGRPRSRAVLTTMLRAAGFTRVTPLTTSMPLQTGVLLADCGTRDATDIESGVNLN